MPQIVFYGGPVIAAPIIWKTQSVPLQMPNLQEGVCREIEDGVSSKDAFQGETGDLLLLQEGVYQSVHAEESRADCPWEGIEAVFMPKMRETFCERVPVEGALESTCPDGGGEEAVSMRSLRCAVHIEIESE